MFKILMNSLYGRFGINPKCTMTEFCNDDQYKHMLRFSDIIFAEKLSESYIISYHKNTLKDSDYWEPPKNSAVQLAAAITASARIYMYPYTSREDCYYTDTDSVVLSQPLPNELISSSAIGLFKLEDRMRNAYFLSAKAYCYITNDEKNVI